MNQQRQNICSTKQKQEDPILKSVGDSKTSKNNPPPITHEHFYVIEETDHTFSDQTGRFPHISSKENRYVIIWYHYAINAILTDPTKNRTEGELDRSFKVIYNKLTKQNYTKKFIGLIMHNRHH